MMLFVSDYSFGQLQSSGMYKNSTQNIYEICKTNNAIDIFFDSTDPPHIKYKYQHLLTMENDEVNELIKAGVAVYETDLFMKEILLVKSNKEIVSLMKKYPNGPRLIDDKLYSKEQFYELLIQSKIRIYYSIDDDRISQFWVVDNNKAAVNKIPASAIPIAPKDFKQPSKY